MHCKYTWPYCYDAANWGILCQRDNLTIGLENLPVVDKDNDENSSLSAMTTDKDWQVMNMFNISVVVKIHTESH